MTDLIILALLVLAEAEGEPLSGKIMVARTVINRAIINQTSIQTEIWRPKQYSGMFGHRWAKVMGYYRAGSLNATSKTWQECLQAAQGALDKYEIDTILTLNQTKAKRSAGRITHFVSTRLKVKPPWFHRMQRVATIGHHIFLMSGTRP